MLLSGHRVVPRMERLRVTVSTMRELRSVRVWEKLSNEKVMLITWVKNWFKGTGNIFSTKWWFRKNVKSFGLITGRF